MNNGMAHGIRDVLFASAGNDPHILQELLPDETKNIVITCIELALSYLRD